jgi:hypothetical protein
MKWLERGIIWGAFLGLLWSWNLSRLANEKAIVQMNLAIEMLDKYGALVKEKDEIIAQHELIHEKLVDAWWRQFKWRFEGGAEPIGPPKEAPKKVPVDEL